MISVFMSAAALLIAAPPLFPLLGQRAADSATLAIVNASVVDVRAGRLLINQTVLVHGRRISAVGPQGSIKVPAGARRLDGRGKYVAPGLIETHAHLMLPWVQNWPDTLAQLGWLLAQGVTSVRDASSGGVLEKNYVALRRARDSGRILAPRLVVSAFPLRLKKEVGVATSAEAIARFGSLGFDQIKIRDNPRDVALQLIREGRAAGIPSFGHSAFFLNDTTRDSYPMAAVQAGIAGLSHYTGDQRDGVHFIPSATAFSGQTPLAARRSAEIAERAGRLRIDTSWQRAIIDTMVARGTWLEPTMSVAYDGVLYGYCTDEYDASLVQRYYPWMGSRTKAALTPEQVDTVLRVCASRNDFVRRFHQAGGTVVTGSDYVPFAPLGVFAEMRLLARAGLSHHAALQAATINAAMALGLPDVGVVETGKLADLLLLDANPLENVANAERVSAVVMDGQLVDREGLLTRKASTPPTFSFNDKLERLEESLRTLALQRPDSIVDMEVITDGTMQPGDPQALRDVSRQSVRVDGTTLIVRGPAATARILTRLRFVTQVRLAKRPGAG